MDERKIVEICFHVAFHSSPGAAAFAAILSYGKHTKEISIKYRETSMKRIRLIALIKSLKMLKYSCRVVIKAEEVNIPEEILSWKIKDWKSNNWKNENSEEVRNVDLYEEIILLSDLHDISFDICRRINHTCLHLVKATFEQDITQSDIVYEEKIRPETTLKINTTTTFSLNDHSQRCRIGLTITNELNNSFLFDDTLLFAVLQAKQYDETDTWVIGLSGLLEYKGSSGGKTKYVLREEDQDILYSKIINILTRYISSTGEDVKKIPSIARSVVLATEFFKESDDLKAPKIFSTQLFID